MNRKAIISHAVAMILGLIGGFLGHDLSGLQAPVEGAVNTAVDAAQKVADAPAPAPPGLDKPAPAPADAGTPAPAPAPADAGAGEGEGEHAPAK